MKSLLFLFFASQYSFSSPIAQRIETMEDAKRLGLEVQSNRNISDANGIFFTITWKGSERSRGDGKNINFEQRIDVYIYEENSEKRKYIYSFYVKDGNSKVELGIPKSDVRNTEIVVRASTETDYFFKMSLFSKN